MTEVLPYVNTGIWFIVLAYAIKLEHRLTKLEAEVAVLLRGSNRE